MTREEAGRRAEVMQHYADGGDVQEEYVRGEWSVLNAPAFDWDHFDYRAQQPAPAVDSEGKAAVLKEWRRRGLMVPHCGKVVAIDGDHVILEGEPHPIRVLLNTTYTIPPRPEPEDGCEIVGCRVREVGDRFFDLDAGRWRNSVFPASGGRHGDRRWIQRKIEPTYRDWKISEVPVGAILISKNPTNKSRSVITQENGCVVWVGARPAPYTTAQLREQFLMEDGTPCGIKETK